jgi:hypothetical protein
MTVTVYSYGLCYASACASLDASREEVEDAVNASHPTGLENGWQVADENFSGGEPNPCPCSEEGKQHWLLVC